MNALTTYFADIYSALRTSAIGLGVTFRHFFKKPVTIYYPYTKKEIPERGRNRLYVNIDDCIGCDQCAIACPVDCITIETIKSAPTDDLGSTSTGMKKRLYVTKFEIDNAKCCFCGLCVPPCPTECIFMTDVYEYSEFDRQNLIYNFSAMTPAEIEGAGMRAKKAEEEAAAKKAAMAAAAAAAKAAAPVQPTAAPAAPKPVSPAASVKADEPVQPKQESPMPTQQTPPVEKTDGGEQK